MSEEQHSYVVRDVDAQTEGAGYKGILTLWAPNGAVSFAVDDVVVDEHYIGGVRFIEEVRVVVASFHPHLPWVFYKRSLTLKYTDQEMFEHELERAQVQKLHKERAESVLSPGKRDEGYR